MLVVLYNVHTEPAAKHGRPYGIEIEPTTHEMQTNALTYRANDGCFH